jgi:hypothetical protein
MGTRIKRRASLARRGLRRRTETRSRQWKASAPQRQKVAGQGCLVCGRRPVDPAHLVPQRLGGCDHRDCVVALCRAHHRLFDEARLRLDAYLGAGQAAEIGHALSHVSAPQLQTALVHGWPPPWLQPTNKGEDDEQEQRNGGEI